jgi:plastocyanin
MINCLMRRALTAVAGAALLSGVTILGLWPEATAAGSAEIAIQNFAFLPPALTVAPGTAVTWNNKDEEPHNIVNVPGAGQPRVFRSQAVDGGDKYSFVFNEAGTYKYICSIHPHMEGTVVVK